MPLLTIDGVVPIIPTPFDSKQSPDWPALQRMLEFAQSGGVSAVCLPAYASEFYKLTDGERRDAVYRALEAVNGGLPIIAQVNHNSPMVVAEIARDMERAGAAAIAVGVPRLFSLSEVDLLRYFDRILAAVSIPLLIQDFNPGGATVGANFAATLRREHGNFCYLKLEEPMMAAKVRSILDATAGEVGVLEGWGGVYMIELMDAGICGVMPGLAVADHLQRVWNLMRAGKKVAAYEIFREVLPQIVNSLQSLEFFHHAEKLLLVARGILDCPQVREATVVPNPVDLAHIQFLNERVAELSRESGRMTS